MVVSMCRGKIERTNGKMKISTMTGDRRKALIYIWRALSGIALPAVLLSGCGKEDPKVDIYPRTPGEMVVFGASSSDNAPDAILTRTDYSGERVQVGSVTLEKVNWLSGDEIVIYGEHVDPSSTNPARYGIAPMTDKTKASLTLLSASGLRWGTGNSDFYAVYPSPEQFNAAHSDLDPMAVSGSGSAFTVVFGVPSNQPKKATVSNGSNRLCKPDMTLAPMLAVSKDVPVSGTTPVTCRSIP